MNITQQDADLLESIARDLSENIKRNYKGDAIKAFEKAVKFLEMPKLAAAKLSASFNARAEPETRARSLMNLCNTALPILKRVFGEKFLIAAMPPAAANQHVVDLCNELGSHSVADLCRKAMGPS
jgi:hypothetical protein